MELNQSTEDSDVCQLIFARFCLDNEIHKERLFSEHRRKDVLENL